MEAESTLLLNRTDVQKLLSLTECVAAVEKVFRLQGEGDDHGRMGSGDRFDSHRSLVVGRRRSGCRWGKV